MVEIFANRIEFLSGRCMKNVGRNFISEARRVRRARLERWRLIVRSLGEKRIEVGLIVPHLTRIAWLKHGTARWFSYLSRVVAIESRNSTLLSELLAAESALRNPSAPLQIIPLLPFLVANDTNSTTSPINCTTRLYKFHWCCNFALALRVNWRDRSEAF